MNGMMDKLATLWPEIVLGLAACACLALGLAPRTTARRLTVWAAVAGLLVAGTLLLARVGMGDHVAGGAFITYIKLAVVGMGLLLLAVAAAVPEQLRQTRQAEDTRTAFEPGDVIRGEFFAFFLFSLMGVMLTAGADDLVWLFLALELTSLPTYVMVAISRERLAAQESAVKYFFLGAMAAAVFLYGFALIYGATGYTTYTGIRESFLTDGATPLLVTGLVLAVVGICFKIAAVPMHFYAADVYEGAASPVTAFLAFVPKTAGFVAIIGLLACIDWQLPGPLVATLWLIAALTMTVGNVLGLLQDNVKRVLAYSSIAHSGYMLLGVLAGSGATDGSVLGDGLAAVLFYLVAYGLATTAAFAVLASLQARGEEVNRFEDLAGLARRHPTLAAVMLLSVLSLIGLPPMIGFLGKIYLFGSAIHAGYIGLVIIAVLNSAISAVYYLRIVKACYFDESTVEVELAPTPARRYSAALAASLALVLGILGGSLVQAARNAGQSLDLPSRPATHADATPPR